VLRTLTAWRGVARGGKNTWHTARSLPPRLISDGAGDDARRGLGASDAYESGERR
jgi:hypothetical protein